MGKVVKCIETGEIFESQADAARAYNVTRAAINACCRGVCKTVKRKHFVYVDNDENDCSLCQYLVDEYNKVTDVLKQPMKLEDGTIVGLDIGKVFELLMNYRSLLDRKLLKQKALCDDCKKLVKTKKSEYKDGFEF